MDPISALSVAAATVQFVDFSCKTVGIVISALSSEAVTQSPEASLNDLKGNAERLKLSNTKLKQSLDQNKLRRPPTETELQVAAVADECIQISQSVLDFIRKIKIDPENNPSPASARLKAIRIAFRAAWKKEHLNSLKQRLDGATKQLMLVLFMDLREAILASTQLQKSGTDVQPEPPALLEIGRPSADRSGNEALDQHWKFLLEKTRNKLYLSVAAYDWTDDNPREPILMPGWTQSNFFEDLFELFMLQLTFNDISVRENRIDPAFDKTFQWIFRSPQSSNRPWSSFVDWLVSPQHVYWITGKAGSGKSTLMKYIVHHQRTQDLLRTWADKAGKKQLVSASFYLWNAGSQIQRTQEGMLRSLLYKALETYRKVASENSLLYWNAIFMSRRTPDHWTSTELEQAFHLLLADTDCNFCLFIDGLDELEGDLSDLIQLVRRISNYPNTKICVSSRPWMIFEDEFATKPQLMLQHLTYPDMVHYINSTLGSSIAFKELCALAGDDRFAEEIVEKIANKSSGVFLWVVLTVRSLAAGLRDGDGPSELERRLDALPPELEDLFRKILHNFESHYFSDAAVLFEINLASTTPPTLLLMSFAIEDPSVAWRASVHLLDQRLRLFRAINMRRRLNSRCKGLLEVGIEAKSILRKPSPTDPYGSDNAQIDGLEPKSQVSQSPNMQEPRLEDKGMAPSDALLDMSNVDPTKLPDFVNARIEYLHRTVREFLERKDVRDQLQAATPPEWNPHSALARAHLLQLKWVYHMRDVRFQSEAWSGMFKALLHSVRAEQLGESQAMLMEALENAVCNNLVDDQGLRIADSIAAKSMGRMSLEHSGAQFARSAFLELMIRCGSPTYLRARICTISDVGTIRRLLETATEQYQEGYYRFPDGTLLHRHKPDPGLVEALLDQGRLSGSTVKGIWRDRIRQAVVLAENPPAEIRKPGTQNPSTRLNPLRSQEDEDDNENIMMRVPPKERVFEPSLTCPRFPTPSSVSADTGAMVSNAADTRHTTIALRQTQDSPLDTQRAGTAGSGAIRGSPGDLSSKIRRIFGKRPH